MKHPFLNETRLAQYVYKLRAVSYELQDLIVLCVSQLVARSSQLPILFFSSVVCNHCEEVVSHP